MKHVIELIDVTKSFGDQVALDKVTLQVPGGAVVALLGENGAGKTTAIRLMLGLETANSGSVQVLGHNSRRDSLAIRRQVGYVPERPTLYEWMTAAEIGWFTAGFYPDGYEQNFRQQVAAFNVPIDRPLKKMSKGMRAKVALSLALAHQPELLILDEPTSGLDTMVRREFLESMVDIAAAGRSVLLSSHQISEVERVADIVAIVREGRVLLVEQLDALKAGTQELTITVAESSVQPPQLSGEVLRTRCRARQWQVLVRDMDEAALESLRLDESIVAIESRTPALEEIFVAYMQGDAIAATTHAKKTAGQLK